MRKLIVLVMIACMVSGCNEAKRYDIKPKMSDEAMYNEIVNNMEISSFKATSLLDDLRAYYPRSQYISKALVLQVYFLYLNHRFNEIEVYADTFIRRYPQHRYFCYMMYMKGMSYYMRISDPSRDQAMAEEAINVFDDIVDKCKCTAYAADLQMRKHYAIDIIKAKKMEVARFYQKEGNIIAAIRRFHDLYDNDKNSFLAPELLYRLAVCYAILDSDTSLMYLTKLHIYYPDSIWTEMAKKALSNTGRG